MNDRNNKRPVIVTTKELRLLTFDTCCDDDVMARRLGVVAADLVNFIVLIIVVISLGKGKIFLICVFSEVVFFWIVR